VLHGQDYNASTLDRIGDDEGRVRNDRFPGTRNSASSGRHGKCSKLLNTGDNLHRDLESDCLIIGQCDVVACLVQFVLRPARSTQSLPRTSGLLEAFHNVLMVTRHCACLRGLLEPGHPIGGSSM
jgi:hypothetical protein